MWVMCLYILAYAGAAGGFGGMAYEDWRHSRTNPYTWAFAVVSLLLLLVAAAHFIALFELLDGI